jgi:hypothetical protein
MSMQEKDGSFISLLFRVTISCFESELLISTAEKTFASGCWYNYSVIGNYGEEMMGLIVKYPHR